MGITREEKLLNSIANGVYSGIQPVTREEQYLSYISGESYTKPETPITRKELYLDKIPQGGGSGGGVTIRNQNKTIKENGTYTADSGYTGLGTVTVEVASGGSTGGDLDALIGRSLTEVRSGAQSVGNYVFYGYDTLTRAEFPNATSIGKGAFEQCSNLKSVYFPNVTKLSADKPFVKCTSLVNADFPNATRVGASAFNECLALTSANFPNATYLDNYCFAYCAKLADINFPKAVTINMNAFYQCYALTDICFPSATSIGAQGFYYCKSLISVDFPKVTSINSSAFTGCHSLRTFILRSETLVPCSSANIFNKCYRILGNYDATYNPNSQQDGYVYVPRALLSDTDETMDYRRATNWSTYASQFRALEDYTVDGTITGALDPTKI